MNRIRRALLEFWALFVIAAVVGFLGPFGTYLDNTLADRIAQWWLLLTGAYLFVRPWILVLRWIAAVTSLPSRVLVTWGVVSASMPLAMIWRAVGQNAFRELDGYAGLLPFSLLCALAVQAIERWADGANERIQQQQAPPARAMTAPARPDDRQAPPEPLDANVRPPLGARLGSGFEWPVIALQSEDHYVRVHGTESSELLLMRLRDAIAEMGDVDGAQVHRSWWVAHNGIASVEQAGRNWSIRLKNGTVAPVARDSVHRLRMAGILPHGPATAASQAVSVSSPEPSPGLKESDYPPR